MQLRKRRTGYVLHRAPVLTIYIVVGAVCVCVCAVKESKTLQDMNPNITERLEQKCIDVHGSTPIIE